MPTLVACSPSGQLVVGAAVWRATESPRMQLVPGIMRLIGRRYYSREVEWLRHSCSYEIVPSPNGDAWFRVAGLEFSPEELVAAILRHIVARAQHTTKQRVGRVTVAVPNMFDQLQRRAMLSACELAEIDLALLLNASSAVALALSSTPMSPPLPAARCTAVLDLGAGYFNVALLENKSGSFEVVGNSGDGLLGGIDFDRRMVDLVDVESTDDIERVCLKAQRLRHALTESEEVDVATLGIGAKAASMVSQGQHDDLVQDELAALLAPCGWMLEDVGLGTDDVDTVVLLGGMTRVPAVVVELAELFRKTPIRPNNAEDLVALGALACTSQEPPLQLSTRSIGVKVRGGLMSPIVPRARRFPWSGDSPFAAPREGQERIVFEVYEGDAEQAADNLYMGTFVLEDLQLGVAPAVTFKLSASGGLSVPGWHGDGVTGDVNFRWAGGTKQLPVRQPTMGASEGGDYARIGFDEQPTAVALDIEALRKDSVRPSPSAPPSSGEPRRPVAQHGGQIAVAPTIPPPSGDAFIGSTVGGRYLIEDMIAEGGMGRVYRATHATLGRKFAVKVLHPELAGNDELAKRFLREAQSAAQIDSDHVIDIVDFGRLDDGTGYFVMEYLEGTTLRDLIEERTALSVDLARDIAMQMADGVAAAHELDIIHRDIKPDNVLLMQRKRRPYFCKILDFGIAKHPTTDVGDAPITMAGSMVGSPYYMSPEQIIAGEITPRTDIYAIGVVLYEMLAGVPPFSAESVAHLLQQHVDVDPAPVRSHDLAASCPASLDALILRCMSKDPADRVESATALVKLLSEAV
jgi:molecular chaperone DnaK (HSP70)